jgi:hypothetical protein
VLEPGDLRQRVAQRAAELLRELRAALSAPPAATA